MDQKIFEAFDELKMGDACTEKIQNSLTESHPVHRRVCLAPLAAAACLLLAVLIFTNATAVQALESFGEEIKTAIISFFYPDAKVEEQYLSEDGSFFVERGTKPNGEEYNHVQFLTGSVPRWLKAEEDGLYFTGNGERIEIGSLISEEIPFTYVLTDENGIRHYIIVGGVYGAGEDGLENVGWAEFLQKAPYDDMTKNWLGGHGTRTGHPWYNNGLDIHGIFFWHHKDNS